MQVVETGPHVAERRRAPTGPLRELGPDVPVQQPHDQLGPVGPAQRGQLRPCLVDRAPPDQDPDPVEARGRRFGTETLRPHLLGQLGRVADQCGGCAVESDVRRHHQRRRPRPPRVVPESLEPAAGRGGEPARRRRVADHEPASQGQLGLALPLAQAPRAVVTGGLPQQLRTLVVEPHRHQHLGPVLGADRAKHRAHRRKTGYAALIASSAPMRSPPTISA